MNKMDLLVCINYDICIVKLYPVHKVTELILNEQVNMSARGWTCVFLLDCNTDFNGGMEWWNEWITEWIVSPLKYSILASQPWDK